MTEGYGILQPRVSVTMSSAAGSVFARVYAGQPAWIRTPPRSPTPTGLFNEGMFAGKGLYHVDAFKATLDGRVPENALLSHDCSKGCTRRAALVTDVEVVDDFPRPCWPRPSTAPMGARRLADPAGGCSRGCRRAGGVERNHLPLISRWKILDNLRRSLLAPALLGLLVVGVDGAARAAAGSGRRWRWSVLAHAGAADARAPVTFRGCGGRSRVLLRRLAEDLETSVAQAILT